MPSSSAVPAHTVHDPPHDVVAPAELLAHQSTDLGHPRELPVEGQSSVGQHLAMVVAAQIGPLSAHGQQALHLGRFVDDRVGVQIEAHGETLNVPAQLF